MNASWGVAARKNSIFTVRTGTGRRRCATSGTATKLSWDNRMRREEA